MRSIKTPSFKLWVLNNITVPPRPKPGITNAHKNLSLYRISGRPWTKSVSTKLTLQYQINTRKMTPLKHRRQSPGHLYVSGSIIPCTRVVCNVRLNCASQAAARHYNTHTERPATHAPDQISKGAKFKVIKPTCSARASPQYVPECGLTFQRYTPYRPKT